MNFKKVVALSICAAMVAGMSASTVMAADLPDQFKDLKANEAYEFPMIVKSFQSTYWDAAQEGMKKAAEELGVTYTAQGPNSESDIADQVNMINTAIASNPKGLGLAACDTSSVLDALNDMCIQRNPGCYIRYRYRRCSRRIYRLRSLYRQRTGWFCSS